MEEKFRALRVGGIQVNIGYKRCVKNIKCNECGKELKQDIDYRYNIIGKDSKNGLLLCDDCFVEFKREISEMWVQY